jgi:hypothetical protein
MFIVTLLAILTAQFMAAPTPASAATLCDAAQFVADVSIPDGTLMQAGQAFTKIWKIKNIGSCTWDTNYKVVFASGEAMGAVTSSALANKVAPGQTLEITMNMTAPSVAGTYRGNWWFKNAAGTAFGIGVNADKPFYVEIRVGSTGGTGYDFAANAANAVWTSSSGALTFPGTEGDSKGFGRKVDAPKLESGTVDPNAGLLMVPANTLNGYIQAQFEPFKVQSGDRFQAIVNCEYNATSCSVNFRLDYQIGTNAVKTLWSFNEAYEGLYYRPDINLSSLAGQEVKFILRVGAAGVAAGDRAMWVAPRIMRSGAGGPTNTPTVTPGGPTNTPTPTSSVSTCDRVSFVADVNVPDGTNFNPGAVFTKTWRLKNVGTCTWNTSYSLVYVRGDKLGGADAVPMPQSVAPGQTVDVSIPLTSPAATGTYRGYWQFKNAAGKLFGIGLTYDKPWWVDIRVVGGPTLTPTATVTPGGPTNTPTPTSSVATCDRVTFVADVTVPDGANYAPGAAFTKTWRLKNAGTCTWSTSYSLVYVRGDKLGGADAVPMPKAVAPGQTVDVSVPLTAPAAAGTYRGYWQFKNASGLLFGIGAAFDKPWWVDIRVVGGPTQTPTPTKTATATVTPGGPTFTPTPTSSTASTCDRVAYVGDVSVPDGTLYAPGAVFTKTWRLKNVGTCTWSTSYTLVFVNGDKMGGPDAAILPKSVAPGQTIDISVPLTAPAAAGTYRGNWQFKNASGKLFGIGLTYDKPWWVEIRVSGPTATPTLSPTATPTGSPTATPTGSPTATPTATPTQGSVGWAEYENPYGFRFKIPDPPNISAESPKVVRLNLPITAGTNLVEKYIDLKVTENSTSCSVNLENEDTSKRQDVLFNGIPFKKQAGLGAAAGNQYDWTAYSTLNGTNCISLVFVLHSANIGNFPTPPPVFNYSAESAVFTTIMESFRLYSKPYAVIDVFSGDVLNVRSGAGTSNLIISTFPYNAINIQRTGPSAMAGGAKWVEVKTSTGGLGWVNSFYLTEYVDKTTFCADSKIPTLLTNLKNAITTSNGDQFASLVSPIHGLNVFYTSSGKRITFTQATAASAFTSTTSYDWGMGPGGGQQVLGSFKNIILPKLLDVFNNPGYTTYCETPKAGSVLWESAWGSENANIRYYSLYRPGTSGVDLDWRTWAAGIEYIDGIPYVTVLMQFVWEP